MGDWQPIDTAPKDGSAVRLKFSDGSEAIGEYWEPPPPEIDLEQSFGGWAYDLMTTNSGIDHDTELDITHWKPL